MRSNGYGGPRLVSRTVFSTLISAFTFFVAACGGGGGSDGSPQASAQPPAQTPADPPAQEQQPPADQASDDPPPSPLPSPPGIPPLAASAIPLDGSRIGTVYQWEFGDSPDGGQGQTVDGLDCGHMVENYHVHTHLSVFLNGEQVVVPYSIGIVPQDNNTECFYSIHTHDSSGKIHVESPTPGTFTLGMFFDVFGHPLDQANFGGIAGLPITVYVVEQGDTEATEYTGDLRDIELTSQRQITVQIGTPITEIPVYQWDGT